MQQLPALRIALAGALALAVAMGIGRFAFTPILPMMQDDAGLTIVAGGIHRGIDALHGGAG